MLNINHKSVVMFFFILCVVGIGGCATSQDERSPGSPVPVTDIGPPPDYGTGVGCSWNGQCYRHPEKTKEEMQKDLNECQEAAKMTAESSGSRGRMYIQEMATFTSQCMLMRAYTWQ